MGTFTTTQAGGSNRLVPIQTAPSGFDRTVDARSRRLSAQRCESAAGGAGRLHLRVRRHLGPLASETER